MDQTVDSAENASVESKEQPDTQASEQNFEAEASKMGWRPKEQFRGDPERWVDAKTFVERGHEVLPIVKSELKKTREELAEVRKAAQEWQEFNKAATERQVEEWKSKYQQAVRDKAEAVNKGDGEAMVEAEARQKELEASRPQPKKEEAKPHPAFLAWREQNPWFDVDEEKTDIAMGIAFRLRAKNIQGEEFFRKMDEELGKRAAPPTRAGPQRGGRPSGESKGARSYENLKPEFRKACDRMVANLGIKKEQYVAGCTDDMFGS